MFSQIFDLISEFLEACGEALTKGLKTAFWFMTTLPRTISEAGERYKQNKEFDKMLDKHLIDEGFLDRITKG